MLCRSLSASLGVAVVATLLTALPAPAQEGGPDGFTRDLLNDLNRVGGRIVELAEAIPADQFGWAPSDEVRPVSRVYMHIAAVNMLVPSGLGAAPPEGLEIPPEGPFALARRWEEEVTAKDAVVAKLESSFEYAAEAIASIPAASLDDEVALFGFPASKRAYLLILLTHAHEHFGQSIAYARSLGITPPWTARQQAAQEAAAAEAAAAGAAAEESQEPEVDSDGD